MDLQEIKDGLPFLLEDEITDLQRTLEELTISNIPKSQESRLYLLDNKLGCCGDIAVIESMSILA